MSKHLHRNEIDLYLFERSGNWNRARTGRKEDNRGRSAKIIPMGIFHCKLKCKLKMKIQDQGKNQNQEKESTCFSQTFSYRLCVYMWNQYKHVPEISMYLLTRCGLTWPIDCATTKSKPSSNLADLQTSETATRHHSESLTFFHNSKLDIPV